MIALMVKTGAERAMTGDAHELRDRLNQLTLARGAVRWLAGEADAEALRALIRACYGESYSYRQLYAPGEVEAAWSSGALMSLGYSVGGRLLGHTGLWCGGLADGEVESGMTMVRPGEAFTQRLDFVGLWRQIFEALRPDVGLVLQQTTTLHEVAQRHARAVMQARPCGLHPWYVAAERVRRLDDTPQPMHALCMVTTLSPQVAVEPLRVPSGAWGEWLGDVGRGLGLAVREVPPREKTWGWSIDALGVNAALDLRRRALVPVRAEIFDTLDVVDDGLRPRHRLEVMHVEAADPWWVGTAHATLLDAGYAPVGVRLRVGRPHELVYQHLARPEVTAAALADARLSGAEAQRIWHGWRTLCARMSSMM